MSLFANRPQVSNPVNYVTPGLNKTILLVGLGNVGPEYDSTRHNIGFACIDAFVDKNSDMGSWMVKKDLKCHVAMGQMGEARVIAVKPTTFMNLSGEAVQLVSNFYKTHPNYTFVVHDELDIDFGHIRLRRGGSAAGHNGIKSITDTIGEAYGRIRIGIGPKHPEQIDSADFVLQKFSKDELSHMPELLRETNAILSELVFGAELLPETRNFLL